jgi:hypothetical protein
MGGIEVPFPHGTLLRRADEIQETRDYYILLCSGEKEAVMDIKQGISS